MTRVPLPTRSGPTLVLLEFASIGEVLDEVRAMGLQPSPAAAGLAIRAIHGRRGNPAEAGSWTSRVRSIGIGPIRQARAASPVAGVILAESAAHPPAR